MNQREAKAFIEVLEKYLTIEQMRGCLDHLQQIPGDKEFRGIIQALVDANQITMPRPRPKSTRLPAYYHPKLQNKDTHHD